jgi:type II secretory pathway predicted ATPase ExeA
VVEKSRSRFPWRAASPPQEGGEALAEAVRALRAGESWVAVLGSSPSAPAAWALRRSLGAGFRVVEIPCAALQTGELCAWALGLLGEVVEGDPEIALLAMARKLGRAGETLVLVVGESETMPVATARVVAGLLEEASGALRLVLLLGDAERTERVRAAFGAGGQSGPRGEVAGAPAEAPPSGLPRRTDRGSQAAAADTREAGPWPKRAALGPARALPYLPRPASDAVLDGLEGALRRGAGTLLLTGPDGIGKTTLLWALERRLRRGFSPRLLPYAALSPAELARFALVLLHHRLHPGHDAEAALLALAERRARAGAPLVLLVDDAHAAPPETHERLLAWAGRAGGALRVVWCASDAGASALPRGVVTVAARFRYAEPLSQEETGLFLRAWLEAAGAPEAAWSSLDGEAIGETFARSAGHPAAVEREADRRLRAVAPVVRVPLPPVAARAAPQAPAVPDPALPGRLARRPRSWLWPALAAIGAAAGAWGALALLPAGESGLAGLWTALQRSPAELAHPEAAEPLVPAAGPSAPAEAAEPAPPSAEPIGTPGAGAEASIPPETSAEASATPELPEPILVHIHAIPWAHVVIDGREIGTTPLGNVPLAPGPHHLEVRFTDGRTTSRKIQIDAENRHLKLEP